MPIKTGQTSKRISILLILLLFCLTSVAMADQAQPPSEADLIIQNLNQQIQTNAEYQIDNSGFSVIGSFVKMFIALGAVLALALIVLRFLKNLSGLKAKGGWLQVLEYDTIGPNKGICVAKIGSKAMVLGVTDNSITNLCTLTPEELNQIEQAIASEDDEDHQDHSPLKALAIQFISGKKKYGGSKKNNRLSFHDHLEDNLRKIKDINNQLKNGIKGDGGNG